MRPIHRGLAATAALAAAFSLGTTDIAAAVPANGQTTQLWNYNSSDEHECVDSDRKGEVYVKPCDAKNDHHQWTWIAVGENQFHLRSVGTGRCLADENDKPVTVTCNNSSLTQIWQPTDMRVAPEGPVLGTRLLNNGTSRYLMKDGRGIGTQADAVDGALWQTTPKGVLD